MRSALISSLALLVVLSACTNVQHAASSSPSVIPQAVGHAAVSKIYVANANSKKITTYLSDGTPSSPSIKTQLSPMAVALGYMLTVTGNIYVANYGSNTVTSYDSTGKSIAPTITGLSGPLAVQIAQDQTLYVLNSTNNTISHHSTVASTVPPITPPGTLLGTIAIPVAGQSKGMALDPHDNSFWIAQSDTGTLVHLDNNGTVLNEYSLTAGITGVAVRPDGLIFVASTSGNSILQLDPSSANVTTFATGLRGPSGITTDANSSVYVTNSGSNTVTIFDSSGNLTTTFSANSKPAGIAVL